MESVLINPLFSSIIISESRLLKSYLTNTFRQFWSIICFSYSICGSGGIKSLLIRGKECGSVPLALCSVTAYGRLASFLPEIFDRIQTELPGLEVCFAEKFVLSLYIAQCTNRSHMKYGSSEIYTCLLTNPRSTYITGCST
jgi:hypothetical protein